MARWWWAVVLVGGALLGGCSTGDLLTPDERAAIIETWELRRASDDGGESFSDVADGRRITFRINQTWSDNQGNDGTYTLEDNRLSMFSSETEAEDTFSTVVFEADDTRLELTYFTDALFRTRTGVVERYFELID